MKEQFFSAYFNEYLYNNNSDGEYLPYPYTLREVYEDPLITDKDYYIEQSFLCLKPFTDFSVEDAKDYLKRFYDHLDSPDDFRIEHSTMSYKPVIHINFRYKKENDVLADLNGYAPCAVSIVMTSLNDDKALFLRNKGYAIPWNGLAVEDLLNKKYIQFLWEKQLQ